MSRTSLLSVDVVKAVQLYARLGSWAQVARAMPRPDGTLFQASSIAQRVAAVDCGVVRPLRQMSRPPRAKLPHGRPRRLTAEQVDRAVALRARLSTRSVARLLDVAPSTLTLALRGIGAYRKNE
jgi:hypothetical protein